MTSVWFRHNDDMQPAVSDILGGEEVLGGAAHSNLELAKATRRGLPAEAVVRLALAFASTIQDDRLGLIAAILMEHKEPGLGEVLSPSESDTVVRVASAVARASEVLGNRHKAAQWLLTANRALGGETPLSLLDTSIGLLEVETQLGRIEHGVYS